jgi:hypothetical protein
MGATNVWTQTITEGTLSIIASDNVTRISVICRGGTISFNGSGIFQGVVTEPVDLAEGQGITLTAIGNGNPLDGISISAPTSSDFAEVVLSRI